MLQAMIRKKSKNSDGTERVTIAETFDDRIYTRVRIQWTEEREKELMALVREAELGKLGYLHRTTALWNRKFPGLRTTETALTRQLYVTRSRIKEINEIEPEGMDTGQLDEDSIMVSNYGG